MISPLKCLLGACVLSLGMATGASAVTIVFEANFLPEGGPGATGTGFARVTFDTDILSMRVEATWSGLSGTTTVAHIHCCTTNPGTGTAGVATQVPTFSGFPAGVTAGSYDQTFDMNLAGSWNASFVTNNGGTTTAAFNALLNGLNNDRGYLNIHSSTFGGGEIRARLAFVPEPGSALLVGLGLAMLAQRRRARV
jgi:hypothetical protein